MFHFVPLCITYGKTLVVTGFADPVFTAVELIAESELEAAALDEAFSKYRINRNDSVKFVCNIPLPLEVVRQNPDSGGLMNQESYSKDVFIRMTCVTSEHYGRRKDITYKVVVPRK
jgi:hypothetical protein